MFLSILMAAAITPAQSARADAVALSYLSGKCADGREYIGIVTAADGILHDITQTNTEFSVQGDEDAVRKLCESAPLIAYHCHPSDEPYALYPSAGRAEGGGDMSSAAYYEYTCAARAGAPVTVEHRIVTRGKVIRYGIRGDISDAVQALARQTAEVHAVIDQPVYSMANLQALIQVPRALMALGELSGVLRGRIAEEYGERLQAHFDAECAGRKTLEEKKACPAFTDEGLKRFAESLDPCGSYFVIPPGGRRRECPANAVERITLSDAPRYSGWTELTPENYGEFTKEGYAVLVMCDDEGRQTAPACSVRLREVQRQLPSCANLKLLYVDTARHGELRERHLDRFTDVGLLEDGRYKVLTVRATGNLLKALICGPHTLFNLPN